MTCDIVELWLIRTEQPDPVLAELAALLDTAERQRASRMLFAADRRRFVAAHGAVRLIMGQRLGAPPAQLRWQHGPHGKPELAGTWTGARVSLSHSGGLTALAVTSSRTVGVDIQHYPAGLDVTRMSARFYPPAEARFVAAASDPARQVSRFIQLWTRKEACVKVAGGRLVAGLMLPVRAAGQVIVPADPDGMLPGPCLVRDVPAPQGRYAALALEGTEPCRITRHWWPGMAVGGG